jgi:hypothetical protein
LEVGQGLFGQARGVGLVIGQDVHHAIDGLHLHRPDIFRREHAQAAALDHGRAAHADVAVAGTDQNLAQAREGGVAGEAAARDDGDLGHNAGKLGEGFEAGRGQARGADPVGVARPPAAALGEPHHGQFLALDDLKQAVGLGAIHVALGAGGDREVVVGERGAAGLLG